MTIWHCCNSFECLHSLLMLHAVGPSDDEAVEIQRKLMRLEIASTLKRLTVVELDGLKDEKGIAHFLGESVGHAKLIQRGELPRAGSRPVSIGNSSGVNFTDVLFHLVQTSQRAISDAQNAVEGTDANLGDICGLTLRNLGDVDFPRLRAGLKIEWEELSPLFSDDDLVSCEDIAAALHLEVKTIRNHYRRSWGNPVSKRGRHDVWRFGAIKDIVSKQKSADE